MSYILAVEELSKVDDGMGITLSADVSLCATPIFMFGTEEQKQKFLTPLATGEKLGAFGLTESSAGTDASAEQSTAVYHEEDGGYYVLNGNKIFITNGKEADIYVIFAMTDKAAGNRGISAFIVEKGTPGFSFGKLEEKMGGHTSITAELVFQDCKIPKENLLGKVGQGFHIAMDTLDGGRIGVAAQALGIAAGAYELALAYSKQRRSFGKAISEHQAIAFKLADMATQIEAARMLVYKAAWLKDQGESYTLAGSMAKLFASKVAMDVTVEAVQIHGGYGFVKEYHVERLMRDAKITQIYEGTSEIQKMVISRSILSK